MNDWGFWTGPGLVTAMSTQYLFDIIAMAQDDVPMYYGSKDDTKKLQAASNPGIDDLFLSVVSTAAGWATTDVSLALSQSALDSATPGAQLSLGKSILGGETNALEIWVRADTGASAAARYQNLKLQLDAGILVPV